MVRVGDQRDAVSGTVEVVQFHAADVESFEVNVGAAGESGVSIDACWEEDHAAGLGDRVDGGLDVGGVVPGGAVLHHDSADDVRWAGSLWRTLSTN